MDRIGNSIRYWYLTRQTMILETSISRWDWLSNNVTRSLSLHTMILQTSRHCKSSNTTDLHASQPRMRTELLRQKSLLQDAADFVAKQDSCLKSRLTKLTSWPSCQNNDNVKPGLLILAIPGPFYWERNHHLSCTCFNWFAHPWVYRYTMVYPNPNDL